jgi:hypothetical protein
MAESGHFSRNAYIRMTDVFETPHIILEEVHAMRINSSQVRRHKSAAYRGRIVIRHRAAFFQHRGTPLPQTFLPETKKIRLLIHVFYPSLYVFFMRLGSVSQNSFVILLQFGIWAHSGGAIAPTTIHTYRKATVFGRICGALRHKPGFPFQVLGFAHANPVGFPLQSLAPRSGRAKSLRDFASSQDALAGRKIATEILRPAPLPVPALAHPRPCQFPA